jgi:hypothetical protein
MELTNPASLKRLTGLAFFQQVGLASSVPFGNILAIKQDIAPKNVSAMLNKRGNSKLFRRDNYSVEPVYSIQTNQFSSSCIPLLLMGTRLADVVQASGTAQTFVFTAAKGQAFILPDKNVTISTVAVGATNKTLGVDFFVDDPNIIQTLVSLNGVIILPETAAGIADGATVTVTYDRPAVTREQYAAFTVLNRTGEIAIYLEDETGMDANMIWTAQIQLTTKDPGSFDVSKFTEATFEAAVFGSPIITARSN